MLFAKYDISFAGKSKITNPDEMKPDRFEKTVVQIGAWDAPYAGFFSLIV
jgi:hypothetical protein